MNLFSGRLFVFLLFSFSMSCSEGTQDSFNPIVLRAEVAEGTPGAVSCDYLANASGTIWFGEPHTFSLANAEAIVAFPSGHFVSFEVIAAEKEEFGDLTELHIGNRMAFEVAGNIICAPTIDSRLPGVGMISEDSNNSTKVQAENLAARFVRSHD